MMRVNPMIEKAKQAEEITATQSFRCEAQSSIATPVLSQTSSSGYNDHFLHFLLLLNALIKCNKEQGF